MKMKTVYYLLLGLCLATAACKPDEPIDEIINGTCGDNMTWSYNKTKAILTISGTGKMEDYSYNTNTPWEPYREEIQTIVIGDSVTSIGNRAFHSCSAFRQVNIPESVTSIGESAFGYCSALTKITIGENMKTIGGYAFFRCDALTQVTIGKNVTDIGEWAFSGYISLTKIDVEANNANYYSEEGVLFNKNKTSLIQYPIGKTNTTYTIPNGVIDIEPAAFRWCFSLTQVTIPNSVKTIGDEAFWQCIELTQILIPNSVIEIGEWVFGLCSALTEITVDSESIVYCSENGVLFNKDRTTLILYPAGKPETTYTIPNSVTSIGDAAFYYCSTLTQVTIPNSVTSIGNSAFLSCSALTQVTIGDGVTSIGNSAFRYCSALTQVTIPNSVTSIGNSAFENCSALTDMTVMAIVPPTTGWDAFDGVDRHIPVYVPAESLEAYKAEKVWKEYKTLQAITY